jgi:uncharacterized protein YlzI (FlbEa/FlbD family)
VNPAFVVTIEQAADTVLHLSSGTSIMVTEKAVAVVELITGWQRRIRQLGGE